MRANEEDRFGVQIDQTLPVFLNKNAPTQPEPCR
jgi:hypothetical protein